MKRFKKAVALMLSLVTMLSLTVSANALKFVKIAEDSKPASNIGVSAIIRGEIWHYNDIAPSGILWEEPSAVTIVDSRYTMAEVTVDMRCVYNDTGELVSPNATSYNAEYNTNEVEAACSFGVQRAGRILVQSAHGATYTRSDVLYMQTFL